MALRDVSLMMRTAKQCIENNHIIFEIHHVDAVIDMKWLIGSVYQRLKAVKQHIERIHIIIHTLIPVYATIDTFYVMENASQKQNHANYYTEQNL